MLLLWRNGWSLVSLADPSLQDLSQLTAVELRDALASGEVSAREATSHFLAAIDSTNKQLGAFVTVTADQAMTDATSADQLHAQFVRSGRRNELPPLHGMPTAFKDLTDVAGVPTTHGSAALEHKPALEDGALAATLKAHGVISLGKTQVPEFGLTAYSENRVAPPSRNPHSLARSSGGSSGGSAAAVAAGLVPFAPGTDGGGSIRIPAGACGLVGLKPGRGVVPSGAGAGDAAKLVVAGPLAKTAADAALLMDALVPRGQAPDGGYLANVGRAPGPLRIGVTLDSPWAGIYPFQIEQEAIGRTLPGDPTAGKGGPQRYRSRNPLRQPLSRSIHHGLDGRRRKCPDSTPARGVADPADPDVPASGTTAEHAEGQRGPGFPEAVRARHHRAVLGLGPDAHADAGANTAADRLVYRWRSQW